MNWWGNVGEKKPRIRYMWGVWWCSTGGGWWPIFSGRTPEEAYKRCKSHYLE